MKKLLLLLGITLSASVFAQANSTYLTRVNQVLQANIQAYNSSLVGYGLKGTGRTESNNALDYIVQKYKDFGYADSQITYDNFTYSGNTVKNVIITKTGTVYPDQYVIVCGHYDSFYGTSAATRSVGANDNGTGVATIMEMARILKDIPTEYSIKFIHFTGEEQGLLGSKNYVSKVVNGTSPKMNIRLVFNIDMIGGVASQTNNSIFCEADRLPNTDGSFNVSGTSTGTKDTNDLASYNFTVALKNYVGYYSTLAGVFSYAYNSDYMPFENNGEVVLGFYERPTNTSTGAVVDPNPYYHKNTDIASNLSFPYVYQITKAALGALQHFAVADTSTTLGTSDINKVKDFDLFPNPTKEVININLDSSVKEFSFEISDITGRKISTTKNKKQINTSNLKPGIYIGTIESEKGKASKKFIIQ